MVNYSGFSGISPATEDRMLFTIAISLMLITALLLHLDDLFLDLYGFFKRLKPRALLPEEEERMANAPQRRFAILLPNWQEGEQLEKMVSGNLDRLDYDFYSVFLGVYPNDYASWQAARRLEKKYAQVSVIVNDRHGPSSRAQLLNEMVRQILASEEETGIRHEAFLLLGPEDVLHPLSLSLLNKELETADLVHLPLLSLPLSWNQFTAGAYADETAEAHKDFLARHALGASLPGTGAGIALSRTLLTAFLSKGKLLREEESAETYQLGLEAGRLGFRSSFASAFRWIGRRRDFIAARKFFPESTQAAIRQKARWTTGIAFQGAARFGWQGKLSDRYFLWRDRRGPWTTLFLALASCLFLVSAFQSDGAPPLLPKWMETLSMVNAAFWLRRVAWRMRTTSLVHGWAYALLVPLRWPVLNFLNSISTWRALALYRESLRTGNAPAWAPRTRKLPEYRA